MWEFLGHPIAGAIGTTRTARRLLKPAIKLFVLGVVIAGVIYAYVMFKAVYERSQAPNVHIHSTH
jgi:hypothetical protein